MVWLRNGTTFMNSVVEMFGEAIGGNRGDGFEKVIPMLLDANPDCGGILALPFMDDEPGINVHRGGTAMLVGLNSGKRYPGQRGQGSLTCHHVQSSPRLRDPRRPRVSSNGISSLGRTDENAPNSLNYLLIVFANPVTLLESAEEGTAWGAALMAKYRSQVLQGSDRPWSEYLKEQAMESPKQIPPRSCCNYGLRSGLPTVQKTGGRANQCLIKPSND